MVGIAFLAFVASELAGDDDTRPATRAAFGGVVAHAMGVSVTGIVSGLGDVWAVTAGVI